MADHTPTLTTTQVANSSPVLKSEPAIVEKEMELSPAPTTHSAVIMAAHLITFLISCIILYFGKVVFIPLALALLFTFMLNPSVKALQRWNLSRTWSVIVVVTMAFALLVGTGYFIYTQISTLAKDLPQYRKNITQKVQSIRGYFKGGTMAEIQSTVANVAVEIEGENLEGEKLRIEAETARAKSAKMLNKAHLTRIYSNWAAVGGVQEVIGKVAWETEKTLEVNRREEEKSRPQTEQAATGTVQVPSAPGKSGLPSDPTLPANSSTKQASEGKGSALGKPSEPVPVYITSPDKLVDLGSFSSVLPAIDALTVAGLVLVLVIMILLRWEDMRNRLISLMDRRALSVATKAFNDAGHRITKYLVMQFCLNAGTGIVIWLGLWMIGVQHAPLWGICAAIFRYIPYAGPAIAALLPISFSIITSTGWEQPTWVIGFILTLELISNNFVEPVVYGSRLGLSEIGIILAAVAWTFLWGAVGLVMATPLTVCLVVLGEYIPAFSLFPRLLSDKPVLEPHYSLYQRLLSHDDMESKDIIYQSVLKEGADATISNLLVPALGLAQADAKASMLEAGDEDFIKENVPLYLDHALEKAGKAASFTPSEEEDEVRKVAVDSSGQGLAVVWPMNPLATAAAGMLEILMPDGYPPLYMIPSNSLTSSLPELQTKQKTAALCLVGLNESDVSRIRKIIKRLRASTTLPIVVSLPNLKPDAREAIQTELREVGASLVSKDLSETAVALQSYLQATA